MDNKFNLQRFIDAQETFGTYDTAVEELRQGRKQSHWIWYVFPQMKGLGHSYNSNYYGITCREEAEAYLADEVLSERLRKVCQILLEQGKGGKDAMDILGGIDARKVKSCLTLFDAVSPGDVFGECLDVCFAGGRDRRTLGMIQ